MLQNTHCCNYILSYSKSRYLPYSHLYTVVIHNYVHTQTYNVMCCQISKFKSTAFQNCILRNLRWLWNILCTWNTCKITVTCTVDHQHKIQATHVNTNFMLPWLPIVLLWYFVNWRQANLGILGSQNSTKYTCTCRCE